MNQNISCTKTFNELTEDELAHLAVKTPLPEKLVLDTARETVSRFHESWQAEKTNLAMTMDFRKAIERNVKTVPLAL